MKIKFKDWFKVDLALYDEIHKSLGKRYFEGYDKYLNDVYSDAIEHLSYELSYLADLEEVETNNIYTLFLKLNKTLRKEIAEGTVNDLVRLEYKNVEYTNNTINALLSHNYVVDELIKFDVIDKKYLVSYLKFLITFLKNVITHSYKRYDPEMLVDSDGYDKLRVDHLEEDLISLSKYIVDNTIE